MTDHSKKLTDRRERTLGAARALIGAGIKVFPCKPFSKAPATRHGLLDASCDDEQIEAWFDNDRGYNLAVACGPQPCGINLLAVDIDPKNGGLETWQALTDAHGVPLAPRHETPSDGFHLFFDVPDGTARTGPAVLGPGVDTRGEGGYVVIPPSQLHNGDGEVISYRTTRAAALAVNPPFAAPLWLLDLLSTPEPLTASIRRHPSQQPTSVLDLGDSVADLAREGWDWYVELEADGWTLGRRNGANQTQWTRPGKNPREGTSATLHEPDGPLVTYSTSLPAGRAPAQSGAQYSFTPWDYIVAFRAGGNNKVAAALVRGVAPPARAVAGAPPLPDDTPTGRLPTLPVEFWAHPINAHILAAARARRCGPDALALNVLLRASMLIPPSLLLPPLSGGFSPINLLGCVVGRTGEGKSVSIAAAADVLGIEHPWLLWDMPLGSGEGVGEVFMMDELEDDEKGRKRRTGRRVQNPNLHAVHFTVDEGAALVEQSTRKGATIIPALCKAWTGVTLGETNADVMTRRRVKALSYRVAAVINIQPTNFHRLFNTANTGTGLTGRFLFAPAADYDMPDERGTWPGPLDFPELHGSAFGNEISYHPDIYAEVDAAIVAANRGGGTPENVSHANLLRARIAAIYALWDDRRTIAPTDWYTAGLLTATSAEALDRLDLLAQARSRDERHSTARARAEVEIVVEDVKERQAIARMAAAIQRKVPDIGIGRNGLRKLVSSASTKYRFDDALTLAMSNGWVQEVGDRIKRV